MNFNIPHYLSIKILNYLINDINYNNKKINNNKSPTDIKIEYLALVNKSWFNTIKDGLNVSIDFNHSFDKNLNFKKIYKKITNLKKIKPIQSNEYSILNYDSIKYLKLNFDNYLIYNNDSSSIDNENYKKTYKLKIIDLAKDIDFLVPPPPQPQALTNNTEYDFWSILFPLKFEKQNNNTSGDSDYNDNLQNTTKSLYKMFKNLKSIIIVNEKSSYSPRSIFSSGSIGSMVISSVFIESLNFNNLKISNCTIIENLEEIYKNIKSINHLSFLVSLTTPPLPPSLHAIEEESNNNEFNKFDTPLPKLKNLNKPIKSIKILNSNNIKTIYKSFKSRIDTNIIAVSNNLIFKTSTLISKYNSITSLYYIFKTFKNLKNLNISLYFQNLIYLLNKSNVFNSSNDLVINSITQITSSNESNNDDISKVGKYWNYFKSSIENNEILKSFTIINENFNNHINLLINQESNLIMKFIFSMIVNNKSITNLYIQDILSIQLINYLISNNSTILNYTIEFKLTNYKFNDFKDYDVDINNEDEEDNDNDNEENFKLLLEKRNLINEFIKSIDLLLKTRNHNHIKSFKVNSIIKNEKIINLYTF